MKEYSILADYYDYLMEDIDYDSWYGFIKKILIRNDITYNKVLELGCGTGNITEKLCEDENIKKITAFDISDEMLTVAKNKLSRYGKLNLIKQDISDIGLEERYNFILSCCDTFNYIDENSIESVFKKIYSLLEAGGIFIFDLNSYYKLSEMLGNNTFVFEREHIFYTWENEYYNDTEECGFFLNFFIKDKETGQYERFTETHLEKAYRKKDIIEKLANSGFRNIEIYSDFKLDSHIDPKSERIFYIAKK